MPVSRNRKKKQIIIHKVPVHRKRQTAMGEVVEHMGFRVVGKQVVTPKVDRKKTELEKEAYQAWKRQSRTQKEHGLPPINKNNFIAEYLLEVQLYHKEQKEVI